MRIPLFSGIVSWSPGFPRKCVLARTYRSADFSSARKTWYGSGRAVNAPAASVSYAEPRVVY